MIAVSIDARGHGAAVPGPPRPATITPAGRFALAQADDGTVYVRTAEGERVVGSWQAGIPDEALAFFDRVRRGYLQLAQSDPTRFQVLDGQLPAAGVLERAWAALAPLRTGSAHE